MRVKRFLIFFSLLLVHTTFLASLPAETYYVLRMDRGFVHAGEAQLNSPDNKRPNPILVAFRKKHNKDKKAVAAILAFPFPFGIVGLHRIYLGCSPYAPVVYIATAGGVLGILPFIDFCVLLLDKDIDRYINNKKIFMWVN
jgi:TM2 domain-containing membrane protein YozV